MCFCLRSFHMWFLLSGLLKPQVSWVLPLYPSRPVTVSETSQALDGGCDLICRPFGSPGCCRPDTRGVSCQAEDTDSMSQDIMGNGGLVGTVGCILSADSSTGLFSGWSLGTR